MAEQYEVSVRTIEHPGFDPAMALRRLRTFTPGRSSFVLESLSPDSDAGRYSIVGYRVRGGASMPPAASVEKMFTQSEAEQAQQTFAQSLALASVGFVDGQAVTFSKGVRLHDDMMVTALLAERSAVMLYDHHENKVHVAGRVPGKAVERLIWELEHAPELPDVSLDGAEAPADVIAQRGNKKLSARAQRAMEFVGDELEAAVLAEELTSPLGDIDDMVLYRALTAIDRQSDAPHSHAFYVDFGESPMGDGHTRIVGLSSHTIHRRRRGDDHTGWSGFSEALPRAEEYGAPPVMAARLMRDLEDEGRVLWGSAVGYLCPGGEAAWMLAEQCAMLSEGTLVATVGLPVTADMDTSTLEDQARAQAHRVLTALGAARAHAKRHPPPPTP